MTNTDSPIVALRRRNLAELISSRYESQADFVQKTEQSQSEVSGLLKAKSFGEKKARTIETSCGLPPLWLDTDHRELPLEPPREVSRSSLVSIVDDQFDEFLEIPRVNLSLSAGITGFQPDPVFEDGGKIKLLRSWVEQNQYPPACLYAIKVKGDSMVPALYDGDTVVINVADTKPVDGDVFAVNFEGEPVVKRMFRDMGEWWLMSDNTDQRKYHKKRCRGVECIIVGKVVHRQGNRI